MKITSIKTEKVTQNSTKLVDFLDKYIDHLEEKSIIVITSKIISIMENRVELASKDIDLLIEKEADYISNTPNKYNRFLTIKNHAFISAAGIDQSNGNGLFVLLPKNPQKTAYDIYNHFLGKFKTKQFGVLITDSRSMPLRLGAAGVAIGFWGFAPLNSYIDQPDIFGRKLRFEQANVVDSLATAAVLVMGEGQEQTPLAIIEDSDFVKFNPNYPTKKELNEFYVTLDDDIFHQFYGDF